MRYLVIIAFMVFASVLHASVLTDSIDKFVTSEMPISGVPGLAYAVLDEGNIHTGERGEVLRGSGLLIENDTPFVIGSISKSFTALAVMQLVESGKIDLDSKISKYLEAFSDSPGKSIMVRQLLSHTSGYSTLQGNDNLIDPSQSADGLGFQVQRIAQWTPDYHPDTRWAYSNANYYILGALIENMSGQDYADYIEVEILAPIGMEHSFVADGGIYDSIARGHTPWFGAKRPVKTSKTHRMSAPVGGVIASANDIALYLAMMMNGEDDIISAKSKTEMMRPASEASPFYGFGWYVNSNDGSVSHTGLTPGVETLAIMRPNEKKGAVILVNSSSGMGFGESGELFNGISARAFGLEHEKASSSGRWSRMSLFLLFALLPLIFLIVTVQTWFSREKLRAKSGLFGAFSLWFPLVMTLALAWTSVYLIPKLFGVSIQTLRLFSPDLALALVTTAIAGVLWAIFRLVVFYSGNQSKSSLAA